MGTLNTNLHSLENSTRLHLAPMEGLIDWVFREILTSIGGIDQCTTEFIRVTDRLLPKEVFYKYCPELHTGSRTRSSTPVLVQLLGGQVSPLVDNALLALELGAYGVDFNFGCPAKTVNRHDGGAALLKSPERIFNILSAVVKSAAKQKIITAKIRLGFDDPSHCLDIASAVAAAGIETLTVHCRTKTNLYQPPAFWEWIPKIKEKTKLNIIANGEIWNISDWQRCKDVTGCNEFMIGRGAIANPFIFQQIKDFNQAEPVQITSEKNFYTNVIRLLPIFYSASEKFKNKDYAVARTKQWLSQLSKKNTQLMPIFTELKTLTDSNKFRSQMQTYLN